MSARLFGVSLLLTLVACHLTPQNTLKTIADVSACVDNHLDEPPATIALQCGIDATPDLISLLEQRRQARSLARFEGYAEGVAHGIQVAK